MYQRDSPGHIFVKFDILGTPTKMCREIPYLVEIGKQYREDLNTFILFSVEWSMKIVSSAEDF